MGLRTRVQPAGRARLQVPAAALALLATACGMAEPLQIAAQPPEPAITGAPMNIQDAGLRGAVEASLDDAARRSGLARSSLTVTAAEDVTWPDGSLGCPQPGMVYTQALVPGYRIQLRAGSQSWDYHADMRGRLVLCPPGQAGVPLPAQTR